MIKIIANQSFNKDVEKSKANIITKLHVFWEADNLVKIEFVKKETAKKEKECSPKGWKVAASKSKPDRKAHFQKFFDSSMIDKKTITIRVKLGTRPGEKKLGKKETSISMLKIITTKIIIFFFTPLEIKIRSFDYFMTCSIK